MEQQKEIKELWFYINGLPPSVNEMYFTRGRRRWLTKQARAFKESFIAKMGNADPTRILRLSFLPEQKWEMRVWLAMDKRTLYSSGYGKDKRIKYPYKNIDPSNRLKSLEDALFELLGISDRNNFRSTIEKIEGSSNLTIIRLSMYEEQKYAFPSRIQTLIEAGTIRESH